VNKIFPLTRFGAGAFNEALDLDNIFEAFFNRPNRSLGNSVECSTVPQANVRRVDNGYEITIAAPGFSRSDFSVNVDNRTLTIASKKEETQGSKSDIYTSREYSYSTFSRSWSVPEAVDVESIDARYDAGILYVTVPTADVRSQQVVVDVK
jgi:HSP20 family protein